MTQLSNISRDQAAQIAAHVLRFKAESDTFKVGKVVALDEITWAPPLPDYGVSRDIFGNSWIVYLHRKEIIGLMSSTIMVVSRDSGHVLYLGSANDEG